MVDVRIDFASLYESMVLEDEGQKGSPMQRRPTVYNYLKTLKRSTDKVSYTRSEMRKSGETQAGVISLNQSSVRSSFLSDPKDASARLSAENLIEKNLAAGKRQAATFQNDITSGVSRVSDDIKATSMDNASKNIEFIRDEVA
jgi:hypothetical protein